MENKQTTINVLKQHIQDAIEKSVVDNHYESGYKQCLIDIQNKIDDGLLQMEKEQIEIAFAKSYLIGCEEVSYNDANKASENYYNETYGGNNSEITMNNQSSTFPYVCASCNKEMVAGGFPKWFCLHTTCKNYLKPITK
jgi:hypothetical protein